MQRRKELPQELRPVAGRIAAWREERERVGPMPGELWRNAVELAGRYGISPTARGLKLDYGCLKTRYERELERRMSANVEPLESTQAVGDASADESVDETFRFVEIDGARLSESSVADETTIEMVRCDGATMTVRLPSTAAFDLGSVVESFWRRRP